MCEDLRKREVEMKELILISDSFGFCKQAVWQCSTCHKVAEVLSRNPDGIF